MSWHGVRSPGLPGWRGETWPSAARPGLALPDQAQVCLAWPCRARLGQGLAKPGQALPGQGPAKPGQDNKAKSPNQIYASDTLTASWWPNTFSRLFRIAWPKISGKYPCGNAVSIRAGQAGGPGIVGPLWLLRGLCRRLVAASGRSVTENGRAHFARVVAKCKKHFRMVSA